MPCFSQWKGCVENKLLFSPKKYGNMDLPGLVFERFPVGTDQRNQSQPCFWHTPATACLFQWSSEDKLWKSPLSNTMIRQPPSAAANHEYSVEYSWNLMNTLMILRSFANQGVEANSSGWRCTAWNSQGWAPAARQRLLRLCGWCGRQSTSKWRPWRWQVMSLTFNDGQLLWIVLHHGGL